MAFSISIFNRVPRSYFVPLLLGATVLGFSPVTQAADLAAAHFHEKIQPILTKYCSDCHMDGMSKGNVSFDEFKSDKELVARHDLWAEVLKNTRARLMPPQKKDQPTDEERAILEKWIKFDDFGIDAKNPDPGRVTVHRLNRFEYRNTIRDLLGVDFDTQTEFPPDDAGHGFDNISSVLTLPPLLMEKYMDAANTIISKVVPMAPGVVAETVIDGHQFLKDGAPPAKTPVTLSYYETAAISNRFQVKQSGHYKLAIDFVSNEKYVENTFDTNKCEFAFMADGKELLKREFVREGGKPFHFEYPVEWQPGNHDLVFSIKPLTPDYKQIRNLTMRIDSVTVKGPLEEKYWVRPANYARFFPKEVPKRASERRAYARELLGNFAARAFRRPADTETIGRLVGLAEGIYSQPRQTFETGVADAMMAVLASPRFLFREEQVEPNRWSKSYPLIDEYSLASRLSYFLWSSMPDDELTKLAASKQLRKNLPAQIKRMLNDPHAKALVENFSGQWLEARDIDTVQIDARTILARDDNTAGNGGQRGFGGGFGRTLRADLDVDLRRAMRNETEMYFGYIIHEDRSVLEFLESDYTFLNERLAKHYGLTNLNVVGTEMKLVKLPGDSVRGGILTQGTVLAVTSNPTRTSPVKRGLFVLDNILGTPPPPPPPDIPPLEDAGKGVKGHTPTLRETLEIHRSQAICSSCHNRMDPLGLALENFNAMGMWREKEQGQAIDVSAKLITGESFKDVREVKHILATRHARDFYRTLTEKMLTYALGRGLENYDTETVDQIVDRLEKENGKMSALLTGVIESAPFQKRRDMLVTENTKISQPVEQRAELKTKP